MEVPMSRFFSRRHLLGAGGALAFSPLFGPMPLAGAAAPALPTQTPPGPLSAYMPPIRVFDSRQNVSPMNGAKLKPGESVAVTVPADFGNGTIAVAVLLNCTVTQTEVSGYLVIRGSDLSGERPLPATSNINWTAPNQTVANLTFTDVGGENAIEVHNGGPGATHFIIDVQGFVPINFTT
jgi:hypothetical protein